MFNTVSCSVATAIVGTIVLGGCTRRQPAPPIVNRAASTPVAGASSIAADKPPAALTQVGQSAEDLFDAARASKWKDAGVSVHVLKESTAALSGTAFKPDLLAQLRSRVADLEHSVEARQRVRSMDFANGITLIAADLSAPYQADIPYRIVLLDYYGRQLELGVAASRPSTLHRASVDLRQTWNAVEPSILRRGDVDDARRFTDIVVQLQQARRPSDFAAPARAELAAVDRLKAIYRPSP
jgi:hypothetical protein